MSSCYWLSQLVEVTAREKTKLVRCVWLEEWKSGRIENGGRIEKILISLIFVWLGVKKWRDGKSKFV